MTSEFLTYFDGVFNLDLQPPQHVSMSSPCPHTPRGMKFESHPIDCFISEILSSVCSRLMSLHDVSISATHHLYVPTSPSASFIRRIDDNCDVWLWSLILRIYWVPLKRKSPNYLIFSLVQIKRQISLFVWRINLTLFVEISSSCSSYTLSISNYFRAEIFWSYLSCIWL